MDNFKNDIERYIKGELTPAEMHRLEKMALSDPFLADALEGGEIAGENFSRDLQDVEIRLEEKQNHRKPWFTSLRIAASLGLLLVASYFLYTSYFRPGAIITPIAKVDSISSEPATNSKIKDSLTVTAVEQPQQKLLSFDHSTPKDEQVMEDKISASSPAPVTSKQEVEIAKLSEPEISAEPASKDSTKVEEEIIDITKDKKRFAAAEVQSSKKKTYLSPQEMLKDRVAGVRVISREDDKAPAPENNVSRADMITGRVSLASRSAAGVHVIVKGTSTSTKTDAQGNYEIPTTKNKSGQSLIFSSEGFQTTEVNADEQSNINIQLSDDAGKSAEVVVGAGPSDYDKDDPSTIFAQPIKGERDFNKYLEKNLHYPMEAMEKKIQGKVWVEFKVKKDSSLTDFRVLHGIGYGCDEELIRLIKAGPTWIPLQQSEAFFDSKVRVRFKFSLPR